MGKLRNGETVPSYRQKYFNTLKKFTYLTHTLKKSILMESSRAVAFTSMLKNMRLKLEKQFTQIKAVLEENIGILLAEQSEITQIVEDLSANKINPEGSQLTVILHTLKAQEKRISELQELINSRRYPC